MRCQTQPMPPPMTQQQMDPHANLSAQLQHPQPVAMPHPQQQELQVPSQDSQSFPQPPAHLFPSLLYAPHLLPLQHQAPSQVLTQILPQPLLQGQGGPQNTCMIPSQPQLYPQQVLMHNLSMPPQQVPPPVSQPQLQPPLAMLQPQAPTLCSSTPVTNFPVRVVQTGAPLVQTKVRFSCGTLRRGGA